MTSPDVSPANWRDAADRALGPVRVESAPREANARESWRSGWPDLVGFAVAVAIAWFARWKTGDLVWSLWLSSLVVGGSIISWSFVRVPLAVSYARWSDQRARQSTLSQNSPVAIVESVTVMGAAVLLMLALKLSGFMLFHFVHSQFLIRYFPLTTSDGVVHATTGLHVFGDVFRRYAVFLPATFLAHWRAFAVPRSSGPERVASMTSEGTATRQTSDAEMDGAAEPYRDVLRMHLLIFAFAGLHFVGLNSFPVYALVYGLYYFPWQLVIRRDAVTVG